MGEQRWGCTEKRDRSACDPLPRLKAESEARVQRLVRELNRTPESEARIPPTPARKLYTLNQLTRALAETDPELVAIATKRTEGDPARLERCLATAVERDEAGARTRAEKLVERARGRLGR